MYLNMKKQVYLLFFLLQLFFASLDSHAEIYPSKTIKLLVSFPAGGGADNLARTVSQELSIRLNQPVIIDNKPGAGGNLAADLAAKSPSDGYILFLVTVGNTITSSLNRKSSVDLIRDFSPVTLLASIPFVLVTGPAVQINSLQELIQLSKIKELTYASSGSGGPSHLAMEMFQSEAKVKLLHVPYKGVSPALADLMGGEVMMTFSTLTPAIPLIKSGKIRAIGIANKERSNLLTGVPTFSESGFPGFEASTWFGILVPANTPKLIVEKLQSEISNILKDSYIQKQLSLQGYEVIGNSSEEFSQFLKQEISKWTKAIKKAGTQLD